MTLVQIYWRGKINQLSRATRGFLSSLSLLSLLSSLLPLSLLHGASLKKPLAPRVTSWLKMLTCHFVLSISLNFALDEINSNEHPYNISFGLEVRDTCADGEEALEQALGLIRDRKQDGVMPRTPNQAKVGRMHPSRPVIGVIWDSANEDVATLFGLFKVPHVSFTRRAGSLSQYSFNSISVEYYQALALADLVRYFAWSSISLVYSTRNYRVFSTFQQVSGVDGICVASTIEVNEKELGNFSVAIQRLLSELQTRVVILFTTLDHTAGLLKGKT